jgi:hypothetical protein
MKKVILSICFLFAAISFVSAQQGQGGGGFNTPEGLARQKQMLKDSLQLTDVQADSAVAIRVAFQPRMRELRQDQNLSDADRTSKMQVINDEQSKKLQAVLGAELGQKVAAFYARNRGRRPQGQ